MTTRPSTTTVLRAALALVILAVPLSCGGDDDDDDASSTPDTTAAPEEGGADDGTDDGTETTVPPDDTAALPDPCALVTQAEAETLAGTPLDAPVAVEGAEPSCTYTGPVTGPTAQVEVYVGDGAKKFYDTDVALEHPFTPIEGIADEAYLEEFTIFFRKGETWTAIHLVRLEDAAPFNDPLVAAATTAAGRM